MLSRPAGRLLAAIGTAAVVVSLVFAEEPAQWPSRTGSLASEPNIVPVVAKVSSAEPAIDGKIAFPKMLADARAAYGKTRDYMAHMVRQERINGTLQAEQVGELRVRVEPHCVHVKLISPKSLNGWEASYMAGKNDGKVRFKPAGVSSTFVSLPPEDGKMLADSLHSVKNTGLLALLNRAEAIVEIEKKANNPVQILVADYTFNERPVQRFEIYTERPHPKRYAHRSVLFVDKETKLPVRFEAYDQPKGGSLQGELIECVSFLNLKFNSGLGDNVFER